MTVKKTAILNTALRLFNKYGFGNVGIDRIIAESNVAKKTFYNHFSSKDNLIVECLRIQDNSTREQIANSISKSQNIGKTGLDGIFDYYDNLFNSKDFFGSLFIKAVGEFPDNDIISDIAVNHKKLMITIFKGVLANEENAIQLSILLDGAIVREKIYKDKRSLDLIKNLYKNWKL